MLSFRLALLVSLALAGSIGNSAAPADVVPGVPPAGFATRGVALGGPWDAPETTRHVTFSLALGFNSLWVPGEEAGAWNRQDAPGGPILNPRFVERARALRQDGVRVFLVVRPAAQPSCAFRFSEPGDRRRLLRFLKRVRRATGISDFVLSFRDTNLALTELSDVVRFGRAASAAHVDLAAFLHAKLRNRSRVWLDPTVASSRGMQDPDIPYAVVLMQLLPSLDRSVGLVWNGPEPISETIDRDDLLRLREAIGSRPVALRDRYPRGLGRERLSLAIALAPLHGRDPELRRELDAYVCEPGDELGGARLALQTIADFLRDPAHYMPESSAAEAISRLVGDRPEALVAMRTQAMEWGGWVGQRNYRSPRRDNPVAAAADLIDPAARASWVWTSRRYDERMAALSAMADEVFREDLLRVMARRLAIANAMPGVVELRARLAAGRTDVEILLDRIRRQRDSAAATPTVQLALDRFLSAAGLLEIVLDEPPISE